MSLFWSSQPRPAGVRYGFALLLVAAAAVCNHLLPPVYGESHYFFFSAAILASALFGGLGSGLLATMASALVSAYFFLAPFHTFRVEEREAAERLAIFVCEGAIIGMVGRVVRDNRTPEIVSPWVRYGLAALFVGGATILKLVFLPALERHLPFTFFYSAIVATAWVGGAGPGLLATGLSTWATYDLFASPGGEVSPVKPALLLFLLEGTALCLLTATFRQRLVETEAYLGRVFRDCLLGVVVIKGGGQILKANPAFRQLLCAEKGDLEGRCLAELVHADSRDRLRNFLTYLWQHPIATLEEICLRSGETVAWANLHGSWIRQNSDDVQTCMVAVEDITEHRKTEEALRETETRLQRGERLEAIGMFAGGVAHDFNNLLTVILGCCETLLQQELPATGRRLAQEILQTAKTGADLTRQLLTFARGKPGSREDIDVNRLVTETAGLLRRLIGARIELKIELGPDAGRVRADRGQLQQILMNLAANARDAMPSGGALTINTAQTHVFAAEAADRHVPPGRYVTLRVADTGRGMDEATRARIFEPLFTTKSLEESTGLGLATVHSIIAKLRGFIGVESSPGNGACFTIYLPEAVPEEGGKSLREEGTAGSMPASKG